VRVWSNQAPSAQGVPQLTGRCLQCVRREFGEEPRKRRTLVAIGGFDAAGRPWRIGVDRAIQLIRDYGQVFRIFGPGGARLTVVHGRKSSYLRSVADGQTRNNLKQLPDCQPPR
jgi:hypothetical protein